MDNILINKRQNIILQLILMIKVRQFGMIKL